MLNNLKLCFYGHFESTFCASKSLKAFVFIRDVWVDSNKKRLTKQLRNISETWQNVSNANLIATIVFSEFREFRDILVQKGKSVCLRTEGGEWIMLKETGWHF